MLDPLSHPTTAAVSFLPRTLSSSSSDHHTFSLLISTALPPERGKENISSLCANSSSDDMETDRNENVVNNNVVERRPSTVYKRGRISLLPQKELDPAPVVDYSVLNNIQNPLEFFHKSEQLANAEKEIKRLRGEVITEDFQPWSQRPRRPGLSRTTIKHTYTLNNTLLKDTTLSISQNTSPPKDSNSQNPSDSNITKEGSNAIPVEISNSLKDKGPKRDQKSSALNFDEIFNEFSNISKEQEEVVLWNALNLKPTDIGETNIHKLVKSRLDKVPSSSNQSCVNNNPDISQGTIIPARIAISDLKRQIFENPFKSPQRVENANEDDDDINDPFLSALQAKESLLSPKDGLKSRERNLESSEGLNVNSDKFVSVVEEFSFQEEENVIISAANETVEEISNMQNQENVIPSYSGPSDIVNNIVKEIASQVQVPNPEVDKDISTGGKNAQKSKTPPIHEKNTSFDIEETSPQNVNIEIHNEPLMASDNTSLPDKEKLVPNRKRGRSRKSNKEVLNSMPNSSVRTRLGKQRELNKEKSNNISNSCSDDVNLQSGNPPESSKINIQAGQEESQVSRGRKRIVKRKNKGESKSSEKNPSGLDRQPEIPSSTLENEAQSQAIESPKEKKQKEARKKQTKRTTNVRKSLADGGLVWESGVRRSTRVKSRPLKHWLGERFLYSRIHESLATVVGVKALSPTSKGPKMKVKSFVPDKYSELVKKIGKY